MQAADREWEEARAELATQWDAVKDTSSLSWEEAEPAVHDGWLRAAEAPRKA